LPRVAASSLFFSAGFLCPLSANTYGIDFLHFKIRDYNGGKILFEVKKEQAAPPPRKRVRLRVCTRCPRCRTSGVLCPAP
jgi:hypothetical protein